MLSIVARCLILPKYFSYRGRIVTLDDIFLRIVYCKMSIHNDM